MSVINELAAEVEAKPVAEKPTTRFRVVRLGVWDIYLPISSGWKFGRSTNSFLDNFTSQLSEYQIFLRLFRDIYALAPSQVILFLFGRFVDDLRLGAFLYIDSRLWEMISDRLSGNSIDALSLGRCLASRILLDVSLFWLRDRCAKTERIIENRVQLFFLQRSMEVNLMLDPTTAQDPSIRSKMGSSWFPGNSDMWQAFARIVSTLSNFLSGLSQLAIAAKLISRHAHVPTFFLLCLLQPLISSIMMTDSLWDKSYAAICINKVYKRLAILHNFASSEAYRVDRTSDGVAGYIKNEFRKTRGEFGDVSTADATMEWQYNIDSFASRILRSLSSDYEIFYFALMAIYDPRGLTFGTVTVLREVSLKMRSTVHHLAYSAKSVVEMLSKVKRTYAGWEIQNQMKDGDMPYPRVNDDYRPKSTGMEVEFRNVGFKYPGTTKYALKDISFKIKPGQMVVIVGVNGSGKSSTVNLFNRLYDVTEGEILVDGMPISMYKLADLRRAMTILRQSYHPYPLSLRLNVALGCPDREEVNDKEIDAALEAGGANEFIKKLPDGLDTTLSNIGLSTLCFRGGSEDIEALSQMVQEKEQDTGISGGETQRLVASRAFMRLYGGGVKFLAADEPTSALDPEAELALFTRLREQRGGKTVVFITHRFGHLTKYADLILVLKDGQLVDSGTHAELVLKEGEYKRLHDVQAQAFLPAESA